MPRYQVNRSWRETVFYSDTVFVEADNEDEASDLARDEELDWNGNTDTEYEDGSLEVTETLELDENDEPVQTRHKSHKRLSRARNLPNWF